MKYLHAHKKARVCHYCDTPNRKTFFSSKYQKLLCMKHYSMLKRKGYITTHKKWYSGERHTKLYTCWKNMLSRCYDPSNKRWSVYGGRGIKVCERWHDYDNFYSDMEPRFKFGLSLDRINTNGNYEPENCRWATIYQQANNRTTNRYITYDGKTLTAMQWSKVVGIHESTIRRRIDVGWDVEKALYKPSRIKNKKKLPRRPLHYRREHHSVSDRVIH